VDLYRGKVAASADDAHELMRGLPEDRAVRDLRAAYSYLRSRPELADSKIGSLGWCMGGGYSLAAALNIPSLDAAVVCYGRLVTEKSEIGKLSCPVLGIFGDQDRGIPPSSVKDFEKAAHSLGKEVHMIIYPNVGHAFMNPNNTRGFSQKIAKEAWGRIFQFLDVHLKSSK
jgi:carboxymethylenebutenolidase